MPRPHLFPDPLTAVEKACLALIGSVLALAVAVFAVDQAEVTRVATLVFAVATWVVTLGTLAVVLVRRRQAR